MRISRIRVENYRSIESIDLKLNRFNIFVGQNNHGKTNYFDAIEWFYSSKSSPTTIKFQQQVDREIIVEIEYSDVQKGLAAMKNEKNKTVLSKMLIGLDKIQIRKTSEDHKRKFVINGEEQATGTGFENALKDFLPTLEYVSTTVRLEDVSKYKSSSPIGKMLSGVLSAIIEENPRYSEFKQKFNELFSEEDSDVRVELDKLGRHVEFYLQKQFPDGTSVEFCVNDPVFEDLLKNFETEVDDGIKTKAEEKGDGMQRAIMLSIIQAYADFRKKQQVGKKFLFMIDEAELHLHPSGQRALKQALLDISEQGDQILINTHSSVLVADNEDYQNIFKVIKSDRVTDIQCINDQEKVDIIYELLGGSPADLLFPKNFLIVEGRSEYVFLNTVINRFYPDNRRGMQISFAGGDVDEQERTLEAIHKMYNPLATSENPIYKDRAIIICDRPVNIKSDNKLIEFKNGYPYLVRNNQLFILSETSLEEYYPKNWKKTYEESKQLGKSGKKVDYAEKVASKITKEEFEQEMSIIFNALQRCFELAY